MADRARREIGDSGKHGVLRRIGQGGGWWLALVAAGAVGLVLAGLGFLGRPHPEPAAGPAAGISHATPGEAAASTATPGGGVSPSPVRAVLSSSPPLLPTLAQSPRPSPRPALSALPAPSSPPPQYLTLDPASGAATLTPPWSTSACPSGYQGSAVLFELNADGSIASSISGTVYSVSAPFGGTLDGPVGQLITLGSDVQAGGTSTWVVGCFAGIAGTGARQLVQSTDVHLSADGSSYTTAT
jgi:hypothetical protein